MANQAWQIVSKGKVVLNDLGDLPKPGSKQALVRIHAVATNYRDVLITEHSPLYPLDAKASLIPGSDGAGIIAQAGPDSIWKKGDRVIIQPNSWKTGTDDRDFRLNGTLGGGQVDGTFRRWMLVDDDAVLRAPDGIPLEEASTIYTAGVTAYRALFYGGRPVGPGMTVLTQGTGGVSCFAILIAAAAGATVVATSSSDEKLNRARQLGATHLINYRTHPGWETEVLKATGGRGVDVAVDVVGAESVEQTLKCTSYGGVVVVVGMLSVDPTHAVSIVPDILFGAKTVKGQLGAGSKQTAEELVAFMEHHQLHPPIAASFTFEEADKALEASQKLNGVGKIVVKV